MTKKLLLSVAALAVLSAPAMADDLVITPYAGVDLGRSIYSYNENYDFEGDSLNGESLLNDGLNNINLHVGTRIGKYFGAEVGYFRSSEGKKNIATGESVGDGLVASTDFSTKIKTHGFSLDGLGYIPLTDDARAELIGTAGITWTKADVEMTVPGVGTAGDNLSEVGFRIGGGAQYHLTNNISARGLVRYQTADFDDIADRAWSYTLGVNYSF